MQKCMYPRSCKPCITCIFGSGHIHANNATGHEACILVHIGMQNITKSWWAHSNVPSWYHHDPVALSVSHSAIYGFHLHGRSWQTPSRPASLLHTAPKELSHTIAIISKPFLIETHLRETKKRICTTNRGKQKQLRKYRVVQQYAISDSNGWACFSLWKWIFDAIWPYTNRCQGTHLPYGDQHKARPCVRSCWPRNITLLGLNHRKSQGQRLPSGKLT